MKRFTSFIAALLVGMFAMTVNAQKTFTIDFDALLAGGYTTVVAGETGVDYAGKTLNNISAFTTAGGYFLMIFISSSHKFIIFNS